MTCLLAVVAATVAACGGAHTPVPTRVLGLSVHRTVGCAGWFEVTGQDLAAHLTFTGPVRDVMISTMSDNGEPATDDLTVRVPAGVAARTVHVAGVTRVVVATSATVDDGSAAKATCSLSVPH